MGVGVGTGVSVLVAVGTTAIVSKEGVVVKVGIGVRVGVDSVDCSPFEDSRSPRPQAREKMMSRLIKVNLLG
jgi:hypothetical protein